MRVSFNLLFVGGNVVVVVVVVPSSFATVWSLSISQFGEFVRKMCFFICKCVLRCYLSVERVLDINLKQFSARAHLICANWSSVLRANHGQKLAQRSNWINILKKSWSRFSKRISHRRMSNFISNHFFHHLFRLILCWAVAQCASFCCDAMRWFIW